MQERRNYEPRVVAKLCRRADEADARSSFREISYLLKFASNKAVIPRLLTREGLEPIYDLMKEGAQFRTIFDVVYIKCHLDLFPNQVKSWSYFKAGILDRMRE